MKYTRLADGLEELIVSGALKHGQRLPSIRDLSHAHAVSIATVVQAYRELESRALAEARARSGYFVTYDQAVLPSDSKADASGGPHRLTLFDDIMPEMLTEHSGDALTRLGVSQLEPDLVASDELKRIMRSVIRNADERLFEYPAPAGMNSLRQTICELMLNRGATAPPEEILITNGCQEALWIAIQCVAKTGDNIAIASPTYPGFLKIMQTMGLRAFEIPVTVGAGIDLDLLDSKLKNYDIAAIYVMPNCSNPQGAVLSEDNKSSLYKLAKKNNVAIIEDDSNRDLYYGDYALSSIKAHDDCGLVIFCSSFSKTIAPSLRVGWLAPGCYFEDAHALKYALNLATPAMSQLTLERFITEGGYRRQLNRLKSVLPATMKSMTKCIAAELPTAQFAMPAGGTFVWIELDEKIDSRELRSKALERGVSIAPGTLFSVTVSHANCLRLGWGGKWNSHVEEAIKALGLTVREMTE